MNLPLAIPVKNFINATNSHDTTAYLAQFTPDADITDWGHYYQGEKGLLAWNATDNIGVNARMHIISVIAVERDGLSGQAVMMDVKSDKFTGHGLIQFYTEGDLIRRIVIEP
ncbi:nuclear transport factor 2 family protein [Yersinia canariae]|uniref:Nuclear transport factor 2 family protein n=1 Tax=Yersinia canariae TaxID=2607663 RepID=A0A857F2V3_9GAMM|nr:nuclear transport factor 2 family protein [Yersinia canariae]QHB33079.1 nuclear transport factor 2 family protein [Yersinia canariae]